MCVTQPHKATLFGDTILEHWYSGKRRVVPQLNSTRCCFRFHAKYTKSLAGLFCQFKALFLMGMYVYYIYTCPLCNLACLCPPPAGSLYLQPSPRSSSLPRSPSRSFTSLSRRCLTSGTRSRLRPSWAPSKAAAPRPRPRPRRRRARHPGSFTLFSPQGRTA